MSSKPYARTTICVVLVVLTLVIFGLLRFNSMLRSMSVTAAQAPELNSAARGATVKLVIEIASVSSTDLRGRILSKKTDEVYVRTDTQASVHWSDQSKLVMGKSADVHSGAVVHVTGKVRQDRTIDADQIVILTGYVKVA
jgi:hypothetical protein